MATVRDIITDAYRVGGIIGLGETPSATEADFALSGLQSMFHAWVSANLFGSMAEVFAADDYTAHENERITIDGAIVTIPTTFAECGEDGNERAPRELSVIQCVTDTGNTTYIYDRREWRAIETLGLNDECPLSAYGGRGLASLLAIELCGLPAFGGNVTPGMDRAGRAFKGAVMRARLASSERVGADYF